MVLVLQEYCVQLAQKRFLSVFFEVISLRQPTLGSRKENSRSVLVGHLAMSLKVCGDSERS